MVQLTYLLAKRWPKGFENLCTITISAKVYPEQHRLATPYTVESQHFPPLVGGAERELGHTAAAQCPNRGSHHKWRLP